MNDSLQIAIIGGGAAGVFAAIRAAELAKEKNIQANIQVFEASTRFLTKVLISGGGRCNVTYHCFDPKVFCKSYPRGNQELISPLHQFQAQDTVEWFENRGIEIKVEDDGRMFPVTDDSSTIVNGLLDEAEKHGVKLFSRHAAESIQFNRNKYTITFAGGKTITVDRVLIATGSSPVGYKLAKKLGHSIEELAPSLFSFNIEHPLLKTLEGISFPKASVEVVFEDKTRFSQKAPILITHWGLSGPGILKLSAWAAREMKKFGYKAELVVNWLGLNQLEEIESILLKIKENNPKSKMTNAYPKDLPKRFWERLLEFAKIHSDRQWANASRENLKTLSESLFRLKMKVDGKSRNKEEFVECGGVSKKEIHWKTMESKLCKGLFFAGEVMDVDGVTGGFNLQNAWTCGWIAGTNILDSVE